MPKTVTNPKAYKPLTDHRRFTLKVEAITDMVPGAWHPPQDLMEWIAQQEYVQSVTLVEPEQEG